MCTQQYGNTGSSVCCNHRKSLVTAKVHQIKDNIRKKVIAHRTNASDNVNIVLTNSSSNPDSSAKTDEQQTVIKRQTIDLHHENILDEVKTLKEMRQRTFSHWPRENSPSAAQMIFAGFFCCNVGDRVICLYCNLILQQWTPHTDDPQEVHQALSPNCQYVRYMLKIRQTEPIHIINQNSNTHSNILDTLRFNEIVHTSACHSNYIEIPKRYASFASWPTDPLPSVDDLVRAGFFYTGTQTVVTCFYCNGSLQNWSSQDSPLIEHCRWFPRCNYAKQLCDGDLYRKIQESKRIAQEQVKVNQSKEQNHNKQVQPKNARSLVPDETTLSRMVAARLDLAISQRLLKAGFKLSIIKRCWEDQLRIKKEDYVSEIDLYIACVILQRQIDCINGKKENIIVPSTGMKSISKKDQSNPSTSISIIEELPSENIPNSLDADTKTNPENSSSSSNLCSLCLTEEKRLACIPCGHFATCVPCGHSLRMCPICRKEIDAFVRIYL
ncbi:hypothetical protein I4U23_015487 [Adineta vaga]|nr:hypothetical protein I4U23_015487 [Adineta vaga]